MIQEQYFAELVKNVVVAVHVVTREFLEANPERYTGTYVETFFDNPNKTYAGIGYTYDPKTNDFIPPVYIPQPPIAD